MDVPAALTTVCHADTPTKVRQTVNGTGVLHVGPSCAVRCLSGHSGGRGSSQRPPVTAVSGPLLEGWEWEVLDVLPDLLSPAADDASPEALDILAAHMLPVNHQSPSPPQPSICLVVHAPLRVHAPGTSDPPSNLTVADLTKHKTVTHCYLSNARATRT